jgi:hypothetical protein
MMTHSKIVDPLYIIHFTRKYAILDPFKKYVSDKYFKLLTFYTFINYIFNNVLMNLSFMKFLFHVPFFCTGC